MTAAGVGAIAVLGGTFNPPHLGHLAAATAALDQLDVETVVLMPGHTPPHKTAEEDPGAVHRVEMCRLLAAGEEGRLRICTLEIERGGPSYTVDTLTDIRRRRPTARLTLIVGADMAATLPEWHAPQELMSLAELAIVGRTGASEEQVLGALEILSPRPGAVRFLQMPAVDVSSSLVRDRVRMGAAVEDLVGPPVASYIARHELYRERATVGVRGPASVG